jgi:hypothetical protein
MKLSPEIASRMHERVRAEMAHIAWKERERKPGCLAELRLAFPGMSERALDYFAGRKAAGWDDPSPEEIERVEALVVQGLEQRRREEEMSRYEMQLREAAFTQYYAEKAGEPAAGVKQPEPPRLVVDNALTSKVGMPLLWFPSEKQPKKRGTKPSVRERVMAEMRAFAPADLQAMTEEAMKAQFRASRDTCRRARNALLKTSTNSDN